MPWYGINHVHLIVEDIEQTTEFYTEVMGFDLMRRMDNPNGRPLLVFTDGTYNKLYFWGYEEDADAKVYPKHQTSFGEREPQGEEKDDYVVGIHHIAWGVEDEDDLQFIKEKLEDYGDVPVWGPINRHNMAFNLYFEDPSGNNLEIHAPGPEASTPGTVRSALSPGEAPETTDEIETGVEFSRGGYIKRGAEDGIAKQLLSSYHKGT